MSQSNVGEELSKAAVEPLLPIEKKLIGWSLGIGKLAAVYVISLFGFVIWVGLLISWLFFAGVHPPLAS